MPGLQPTLAQAARTWPKSARVCTEVLDDLVRDGLLRRRRRELPRRFGTGPRVSAGAR
jgi:hypothetical protein